MISLRGGFTDHFSRQFPYAIDEIICPFWTDLDSRFRGTISHNSILDTNKVNRITQLIQESFGYSFVPTGVFTATWDAVPYHGSDIVSTCTASRLDDPWDVVIDKHLPMCTDYQWTRYVCILPLCGWTHSVQSLSTVPCSDRHRWW